MSCKPPSSNNILPFDVLGLIFSHYASEETIYHPLETLLLVCRCWADAALGHQTLWTHFNIYLGHIPTMYIWDARLPLRLARAGLGTPLYIDLRNFLGMPPCTVSQEAVGADPLFLSFSCDSDDESDDQKECPCHYAAQVCMQRYLGLLAGKEGDFCSRWHSLHLDARHMEEGPKGTQEMAQFLSYPTPNLTELVLFNLQFNEDATLPRIFPNTSLVNDLAIVDCQLPNLPESKDIIHAEIGWVHSEVDFHDLSSFSDATQLQSLRLYVPFYADIPIPLQLPNLTRLHIGGNNFPANFYETDMPKLSTLSVEFDTEDFLAHLLKCKGFHPGELLLLSLSWDMPILPAFSYLLATSTSILGLLSQAKKLQFIIAQGPILSIFLKVLWQQQFETASIRAEGSTGPLVHGAWLLDTYNLRKVYLRGDETLEELEEIAESWDLVPLNFEYTEFFADLQYEASHVARNLMDAFGDVLRI